MSPPPSSLVRPLLTHRLTIAKSPSRTAFINFAVLSREDLDPFEEMSDPESHESAFPIKSAGLYADPAGSMDTPLCTSSWHSSMDH